MSVARHVTLSDPAEDAGATLIKECANKTADDAGDGTTTSTILARKLYTEGLNLLKDRVNPRLNVVQFQRGILDAASRICGQLDKLATPVTSPEQIKSIATISANGDTCIGTLIADVIDKVGKDGFITIEDSDKTKTTYSITPGAEIDNGYLHPIFVYTPERDETHFEDSFIITLDRRLDSLTELKRILPLLQFASASSKPVLLFCHDISEEIILQISKNIASGSIKLCAVKTPGFATNRTDTLGDIAALTGAEVLDEVKLAALEILATNFPVAKMSDWANFSAAKQYLGFCDSLTVTRDKTTLVCDSVLDEASPLQQRINLLKHLIDTSSSAYDSEQLKKRLAKLISGIAAIYVGADTEPEQQELKDRVEDALHATQAAIAEGVLPGGGAALFYIKNNTDLEKSGSESWQAGCSLLYSCLDLPITTILTNAGFDAEALLAELKTQKNSSLGIDASTGEYCDLFDAGILDPLRVTKTVILNSASIAGVLLTTEGLVYHREEPTLLDGLQG